MQRGQTMSKDAVAREGQERAIKVFTAKPALAQSVNSGRATVEDGLACTYQQGDKTAVLDMPGAMGGSETGPTPGFFGRAGVTGCLAIGIKMTALRKGLSISKITVDIEQDFDDRGVFGFEGVPSTPSDTRVKIHIDGDHDEATLRGLVDEAITSDPWFLAYRDAQPVAVSVEKAGT